MGVAVETKEIEEVNANCILMANLQQTSSSGTQADKAPVYDSDGSAEVIEIYLWCVDSGCSKHMSGNLKPLINFVYKFLGTVRFGNDHFCDSDLEVTFRRNTRFVRNLDGVDLLGNYTTNHYIINLHEMTSTSPICLMAHATSTKSWLWHQHLSYLNFDTINELVKDNLVTGLPKFKYSKDHFCPSCEQGKSKKSPHKPKTIPNSKKRALCYPNNDREDIGKLGAKGDVGFFLCYSSTSCAYRVYTRRTKKIMETMNVIFNELSSMDFKQRSSKPEL
ncbi:retrovirus-related pol polyprotein from transposon TNT 1-94 [Tanacetum coccineum]